MSYTRNDIIPVLNAIEDMLDVIALINDAQYFAMHDLPRARILLNNKAQDMRAALAKFEHLPREKHEDETGAAQVSDQPIKTISALLKHTPGPWRAKLERRRHRGLNALANPTIITTDNKSIAALYVLVKRSRHESETEAIANAYLIAAAPDLLEACEGLLSAAKRAREYIVNVPELRFSNSTMLPADSLYHAIRHAMKAIEKARNAEDNNPPVSGVDNDVEDHTLPQDYIAPFPVD